jgi:23S rRNA pseudouridine2604 synthase
MVGIRLSKVMADRGLCSRREADRLIRQGLVEVDGKVVSVLGTRIDPNEKITLAPQALRARQNLVTVLLNKPPGYVSTQPEKRYPDARSLISAINRYCQPQSIERQPPHRATIHVAGRLDIDSSGLLVLTEDGVIARQLIHPEHPTSKEYVVRVRGKIVETTLELLREGISLDGKKLRKADVIQNKPNQLQFILTEGRNRQIRRMCELVGLKVVSLTRTRIGNVHLGRLPRGKWRLMQPDEAF